MTCGRLTRYFFLTLVLFCIPIVHASAGDGGVMEPVTPFMIVPFVLLLVAIAVMPFVNKRWWEKYYPHLSFTLAGITIAYYLVFLGDGARIVHTAEEYVSFIVLIGSLFVVSGGIHIRIKGKSTPIANVALLGIGAIISNVLGTTGASMILIRPYLRVNKNRLRQFHVVFFIFIVSNIGGALTPIGDPPLFLGYLKGVPFFWMLEQAWYVWAIAVGILLLIFFIIDSMNFRIHRLTHAHHHEEYHEDAEVGGMHNIIFLAAILIASFIQHPPLLREAVMIGAAAGSYITTGKAIHAKNDFTFHPIMEVAILFAGIFATMVPALDWLEMNAAHMGIATAGQFYWGSGVLSSALDNAPTYLSFLSACVGKFVNHENVQHMQQLISTHGPDLGSVVGNHAEEIQKTAAVLLQHHGGEVTSGSVPVDYINTAYIIGNKGIYLKAISIAAVFFGACTYIGNGPNFMVKSIVEHAGVKTPTFFGYVIKFSLPILLPVFGLIWWLFFRT